VEELFFSADKEEADDEPINNTGASLNELVTASPQTLQQEKDILFRCHRTCKESTGDVGLCEREDLKSARGSTTIY
jgi:hypothetical protein